MKTRRENKMPDYLSIGIFLFSLSLFCLISVPSVWAGMANHLVINEVQTDSVLGSGGSYDDFVELYNPTNTDIALDGWSLQKQSSASTSAIYKTNLSGTIPAQSYFLLVRDHANTAQSLKDKADILISANFSIANNNTVYLVNNDETIENKEDVNIIDYLGMGNADSFEGSASAPNPSETKSVARSPEGEDTDENSVDFVVLDTPNPQNSTTSNNNDNDLGGTVLITTIVSSPAVQNITPNSADIFFAVNDNGLARINYGLDDSYGSTTLDSAVVANIETSIHLSNLACGTTYHYSIYAENNSANDSYDTLDDSFTTLPCGISVDNISMTRQSARANDSYLDGWAWNFAITVWDNNETSLKMKFGTWTGAESLSAGSNMQFSVDGANWIDITDNDAYPEIGIDISAIDEDALEAGRQVNISVRMKVPVGTLAGFYNSSYGILTE